MIVNTIEQATSRASTLLPGNRDIMNQSIRPLTGLGSGFERFRDIEFLAEGCLGQILAATDPDLNRRVAIKLVHESSI